MVSGTMGLTVAVGHEHPGLASELAKVLGLPPYNVAGLTDKGRVIVSEKEGLTQELPPKCVFPCEVGENVQLDDEAVMSLVRRGRAINTIQPGEYRVVETFQDVVGLSPEIKETAVFLVSRDGKTLVLPEKMLSAIH